MSRPPLFIYNNQLLNYHFHAEHPFNQKRIQLVKDLLEALQMLDEKQITAPRLASEEELQLIHDASYIQAVKEASLIAHHGEKNTVSTERYGLGTEDTPVFEDMHEAAAFIVGGTLRAAEAIMNGKTDKALNLSGGLHHAFQGRASGFCVYNDCSVVIEYLKKNYDLKVLYIDTDAHHGDGVQWAFYNDPQVFTFSIHETGRYLFPGSGHISERGFDQGHGYTLNIPVDAFTQDESWMDCFESGLHEVLQSFQPDIIVSQHGCDAHFYDPLTHLCNSMDIYAQMPHLIKETADTYTNGKWLATGGGGYDIYRVVPRAWSLLWMVMNGQDVHQRPIPTAWLEKWQTEDRAELPTYLFDLPDTHPHIPRQKEIEEKNSITLQKALHKQGKD